MSSSTWVSVGYAAIWLFDFVFIFQVKLALQLRKKVACYSMDAQVLKELFTEENVLDWSTDFMFGGEVRALQTASTFLFSHESASRQPRFIIPCYCSLVISVSCHFIFPNSSKVNVVPFYIASYCSLYSTIWHIRHVLYEI